MLSKSIRSFGLACISLFPVYVFAEKADLDFTRFEAVKVSQDQFKFVEGPAWDGKDLLYFTDIPNNAIYAYSLANNSFRQILNDSEGTNGLLFTRDAALLLCQQDSGRISRMTLTNMERTPLVESFEGSRFNRPNDLVMDKTGGLYFTDPSWADERPQTIKGVYYLSAAGKLRRVISDMDKPNGVVLSPDEKFLYVVDSANYKIRRYHMNTAGKPKDVRVFAELNYKDIRQPSNADGLAMDTDGRLYVSYRFGVGVFNEGGTHLGTIKVAEEPSNLEFAGAQMNELFITAHTNLYKVQLPVRGLRFPQK